MSFTLEIWKEEEIETLNQLSINEWIEHQKEIETPDSLYSMLCAVGLWPLVEAAKTGQFLPVIMALGAIASGVGGNLLAEQIQRWKDQTDILDIAQIAAWVNENVSVNPNLQETLDTILQNFQIIPQTQVRLNKTSQEWFIQTLREELITIGNLQNFEATLVGRGAVIQGEGVLAIGEGSKAASGTVGGDVSLGTKRDRIEYDIIAIRQMLSASLDDQRLNEICFDYFRPVYDQISQSMSRGQKIRQLIEYCHRQNSFDKLLKAVEEMNPNQFRQYALYIKESDVNIVASGDSINIGKVSGDISGATIGRNITIGKDK